MSNNINILTNLVNQYSQNMLNSIKTKSLTDENVKNILLTNARILVMLNAILKKLKNTDKKAEKKMVNQLNTVSKILRRQTGIPGPPPPYK